MVRSNETTLKKKLFQTRLDRVLHFFILFFLFEKWWNSEKYIALAALCMSPNSSWLTDGLTEPGPQSWSFFFQTHPTFSLCQSPHSLALAGVLKWVTSGRFVLVCQVFNFCKQQQKKKMLLRPGAKKEREKRKKRDNPEVNVTLSKHGAVTLTRVSLNCAWQPLFFIICTCALVPRNRSA